MEHKLVLIIELIIQTKLMKYLIKEIKIIIIILFITNNIIAQDTDIPSNLKDFEGIWQFVPPENSTDTTFT